jgi:hypothetical protein
MINGIMTSRFALCQQGVSVGMVKAVWDVEGRPYDNDTPFLAVVSALERLGCEVDAEYIVRRERGRKKDTAR